ncbi:MAG: hypothetical protein DMG78_31290 [Acidobacteria bacterium]|nr:MAG: hypothetical protein DMG78_31290 [Acidobacteriota bacterium]
MAAFLSVSIGEEIKGEASIFTCGSNKALNQWWVEAPPALGFQALQRVHFRLQRVQLANDPALLEPSGLPQRGNVIQPRVERSATLGLNPNGVAANPVARAGTTPLRLVTITTTNPR